jgi:MerR family redox-sensitive transcriptional activator SoxR
VTSPTGRCIFAARAHRAPQEVRVAELSIGEVAERAGIAASAIRYYEAEGLIPKAPRRSGRRVYELSILDRLALIELAKAAGFTMADIKRLVGAFRKKTPPGERWRTLAASKRAELEERIAEAKRMKRVLDVLMGCECPTLDDCSRGMRRA